MKKKNKTTTEIISLPKISQINDENKQAIQQMTLKLTFLTQENSNLKLKVQDLQGLLKQKEELFKHVSFEDSKASAKISTDLSNKYPRSNINNNNKEVIPNIVEALYGENQKLYEILERVSKERDDSDSKVLIIEQILDDLQKKEQENLQEYNRKIQKLNGLLEKKETHIKELEKKIIPNEEIIDKENNNFNNIQYQYRYLVDPSEQIIAITEEINLMKNIVKKMFRKCQELKSKNQDLIQINYSLSNEILSLKNQAKPVPSHTLNDISSVDLFYKKLWEDQEKEGENLSPVESPLPDKVKKPLEIQNNSQNHSISHIIKPENSSFLKANPLKVPKLDLTKAKKIQEMNAKKNFHQGDSGNKDEESKYIEKLKQFDNELMKCKFSLQNEMLHNKLLVEQNEDLKQQLKTSSNQLRNLQKAELIHREKLTKFANYLSFYRNIYSKYLNLLDLVSKSQQDFKEIRLSYKNFKASTRNQIESELDFDKKTKKIIKKELDPHKKINKTCQDIEEIMQQDLNISQNHKKQKYLDYLRSMANDFSVFLEKNRNLFENHEKNSKKSQITAFEMFSYNKISRKMRFHRNNSDILDYSSIKLDNFFELLELHQDLQKKLCCFGHKDLNISEISRDSNDVFNLNLSSFEENLNDVSQTGEILVMNKFHNPFQMNFKNKEKQFLGGTNTRLPLKLYSPLSKVNPEVKEISFEKPDKKMNLSFMSNNDEIFF